MSHDGSQEDPQPRDPVRLDVWLDVACLFRTRSEAQKACKGGKIRVVKAFRAALKIGEQIDRDSRSVAHRLQ